MISGWLLRILITVAILGVVAFEAGSPQIVKLQLDTVAANAALDTRLEWERHVGITDCSPDSDNFKAAAKDAARAHATVSDCHIDPDGTVHVTLYRRAKSLVAYRWKKLYSYYDVRVAKSSHRGEGS